MSDAVKVIRRQKGDVEFVKLSELAPSDPGLENIEIGIRHDGPGAIRRWSFLLQALRLDELRRVAALRAGLSPADAPELYDGLRDADGKTTVPGVRDANGNIRMVTPEGLRLSGELSTAIVAECVTEIRGSQVDGAEPAAIAEELCRLGVIESVMTRVMEVQRLTRAERFPAACPGDV